jgi:hypothetical protein
MKTTLGFLTIMIIIIIGCKKEEYQPEYPNLEEYHGSTMLYPSEILWPASNIKLVYNKKGQIVQRIGDVIESNSWSGYSYIYYDKLADTVVYNKNVITITKHLISNEIFNSVNPYKIELFIENGLMVKKINDNATTMANDNDTTVYSYNNTGNVIAMINYNRTDKTFSKFTYDEKGNLNSIISETYLRYNNKISYRDTSTFSNYDNTPNLTKKLFMFDECFYRSLSTNNFSKYSYKRYGVLSYSYSYETRIWEFKYDENNYIIY